MPNSGTTPGAGGPSEIGAVSVGVTANTAPLKAGLKEAEATVAASGAKMGAEAEKAGAKAGSGFGIGVGHELRRAGRYFHHALLGFMFVPTIAREAYEFGRKIRENFSDGFAAGKERADDFLSTLGAGVGADGAKKNLDEIRAKLGEVNTQLGEMSSNATSYWTAMRRVFHWGEEGGLEGEKRRLEQAEKATSKQLQAAEKAAKAAQIAHTIDRDRVELAKEAERIQQQLDEEGMTAAERIQKRFEDIMRIADELRSIGQTTQGDRLARAAAEARDRALRELAQHMERVFREIAQRITDDVRATVRDTARDLVPDIRAIGPKLDWIQRTSGRFAGRG